MRCVYCCLPIAFEYIYKWSNFKSLELIRISSCVVNYAEKAENTRILRCKHFYLEFFSAWISIIKPLNDDHEKFKWIFRASIGYTVYCRLFSYLFSFSFFEFSCKFCDVMKTSNDKSATILLSASEWRDFITDSQTLFFSGEQMLKITSSIKFPDGLSLPVLLLYLSVIQWICNLQPTPTNSKFTWQMGKNSIVPFMRLNIVGLKEVSFQLR